MIKRFISILLCAFMTASVLTVNASAGSRESSAVLQSQPAVSAVKIKPTVYLSQVSYTWTGRAKKPSVTVYAGSKLLSKGTDYTVSYTDNINVGQASVKVTLKGKYKGSKTRHFRIRPKGTVISSLSKNAGTLAVKWKKQSRLMSEEPVTGYQIQIASDWGFTQNAKTVTVRDPNAISKKIRSLQTHTRYYVRIRTYRRIDEKNYFSSWSDAKSVKDHIPESGTVLVSNLNDEKLLDTLYAATQKNTIISPLSVHMALAMVLEGAEGQTEAELEDFLGTHKDQLETYASDIMKSAADSDDVKVVISNALWYREDQAVEPGYINMLKNRYNAEISDMDFSRPAAAAEIINSWCSKKTNGLIPSIVTESDLTDIADVLLNTLYFKNAWSEPFDPGMTTEDVFYGFDSQSTASYMHSEERICYENDKAVAFEKPYEMNRFSFVGILPKQTGDFTLEDLDIKDLLDHKYTDYDSVFVTMPKFKTESGGDITGILQALGLQAVFTPAADLTGISPELYVSKVIHKTRVILDESGTEAAAATAVVAKDSAVPGDTDVVRIILNRPFAFLIKDNETGNILFMGKISAF